MAWDGLRKMRFTKNGGRMELNTSESLQHIAAEGIFWLKPAVRTMGLAATRMLSTSNFLSGALSPSTATWICNLISAIYLEDTPHMDKIIGCITVLGDIVGILGTIGTSR